MIGLIELLGDQIRVDIGELVCTLVDDLEIVDKLDVLAVDFHFIGHAYSDNWRHYDVSAMAASMDKRQQEFDAHRGAGHYEPDREDNTHSDANLSDLISLVHSFEISFGGFIAHLSRFTFHFALQAPTDRRPVPAEDLVRFQLGVRWARPPKALYRLQMVKNAIVRLYCELVGIEPACRVPWIVRLLRVLLHGTFPQTNLWSELALLELTLGLMQWVHARLGFHLGRSDGQVWRVSREHNRCSVVKSARSVPVRLLVRHL